MNHQLTATQFIEVFKNEWQKIIQNEMGKKEMLEKYIYSQTWTEYMLCSNCGFLKNIMLRINENYKLNMKYQKEWYTIDVLYTGDNIFKETDKKDFNIRSLWYPKNIYAIIEHENGNNIEEEFWKLLFWKCPLKVLIFYDWHCDQKKTDYKKKWLNNKIEALEKMFNGVNDFYHENIETEYLFIIGHRKNDNEEPTWKYHHLSGGKIIEF